MEYKGYAAAIEFDESVGRLHGRVVNSGAYPIATFEATELKIPNPELLTDAHALKSSLCWFDLDADRAAKET